ncbi:MAG: hypothetical protein LBS82_02835 [Spirochaetaceae bacterium]|nr:hypothetical protein [Spirochaetaceae bacterium]
MRAEGPSGSVPAAPRAQKRPPLPLGLSYRGVSAFYHGVSAFYHGVSAFYHGVGAFYHGVSAFYHGARYARCAAGSFSLTNDSFSSTNDSFSSTNGSFSLTNGSFSSTNGSFSLTNDSFSLTNGSFSSKNGSFSSTNGSFSMTNDSFSSKNGSFSSTNDSRNRAAFFSLVGFGAAVADEAFDLADDVLNVCGWHGFSAQADGVAVCEELMEIAGGRWGDKGPGLPRPIAGRSARSGGRAPLLNGAYYVAVEAGEAGAEAFDGVVFAG